MYALQGSFLRCLCLSYDLRSYSITIQFPSITQHLRWHSVLALLLFALFTEAIFGVIGEFDKMKVGVLQEVSDVNKTPVNWKRAMQCTSTSHWLVRLRRPNLVIIHTLTGPSIPYTHHGKQNFSPTSKKNAATVHKKHL